MPKLTIDIPTRLPLREYQAEGVGLWNGKTALYKWGQSRSWANRSRQLVTIYALKCLRPALIICPCIITEKLAVRVGKSSNLVLRQ